jgi:hypothetical protein
MKSKSGLNGLTSSQMNKYKVNLGSLSVEVEVEEKGSVQDLLERSLKKFQELDISFQYSNNNNCYKLL